MEYRKRILKDLLVVYRLKGTTAYVHADELSGMSPGNDEFLAAIDQLLHEGLILGVRGSVGSDGVGHRLAVALNPHRIKDINKEVRGWHRDPRFVISTALAIAALVWAILKGLLL